MASMLGRNIRIIKCTYEGYEIYVTDYSEFKARLPALDEHLRSTIIQGEFTALRLPMKTAVSWEGSGIIRNKSTKGSKLWPLLGPPDGSF
jgi:hypothetical protein